jgi:hypothetical protein
MREERRKERERKKLEEFKMQKQKEIDEFLAKQRALTKREEIKQRIKLRKQNLANQLLSVVLNHASPYSFQSHVK